MLILFATTYSDQLKSVVILPREHNLDEGFQGNFFVKCMYGLVNSVGHYEK